MTVAATLLVGDLAGALLLASLGKLLAPAGTIASVRALGVPASISSLFVGALVGYELFLALLIVLIPGSAAGAMALAFGIALSGLGAYALLSGRNITCNCFGSAIGHARLGWAQIVPLPLWTAAAALSFAGYPALSVSARVFLLAATTLAACLIGPIRTIVPYAREERAVRAALAGHV